MLLLMRYASNETTRDWLDCFHPSESPGLMKPLLLVWLLSLTAILHASGAHAVAPAERPNILIILGDDIDRDMLGPWGGQAHTPHLDQLAAAGVRLETAYANVAMCAPFRQEFFSGRCAWRTRAIPNHSHSVAGTTSLPHYLRPLGYRVGLLGKKHIAPPTAYPFDNVGTLPKAADPNPEALRQAKQYITSARDAGDPFCLVIASHDGHGPYTHGDRSRYPPAAVTIPADAIDTPRYRQELAAHLAEVSNLDALVGDLRDLLRQEELTDNTLVLFCSEQGNAFPFSKWTCFDDGLACGIIAALPGVIPANTSCAELTWVADIAPTLLTAAGGTPASFQCDGKSQWDNWLGSHQPVHEYAYGIFANCNIINNRDRIFPIRSIRDTRYTLIWSPRAAEEVTSNVTLTQALRLTQGETLQGTPDAAASWILTAGSNAETREQRLVERLHHRPEWALYDREKDPEELQNLAGTAAYASIQHRLQTALQTWLEHWNDRDPVQTEKQFLKKQR